MTGVLGGVLLAAGGLYAGPLRPLAPLIALTLFARALRDSKSMRRGAAVGFAFGATAQAVALAFVATTAMRFSSVGLLGGTAAVLLTAAAQALPHAAVGALFVRFRRRSPAGSIAAFSILLHLATFAPGLFPWTAAVPLAHLPEAIQLAAFFGERGLVFALGAIAMALALASTRRGDLSPLAFASGVLVAVGAFGRWRVQAIEEDRQAAPAFPVALVDARVDARGRWAAGTEQGLLEALQTATRARTKPDALVVWPEAAYPFVLPRGTRREPIGPFAILPTGERTPILTGLFLSTKQGTRTNAAVVAYPDGTLSKASEKRHLVLFGEQVPLIRELPFLRRWFGLGLGIEPGGPPVTISVQNANIGTLVCFEDTLPAAGRELFQADKIPNLIVNMTNDAWFTGTAEPELHLTAATFRAVELGRDLVRAVNGGVSAHVTASGRWAATRSEPVGGALEATPVLLEKRTIYEQFGDGPLLVFDALVAGGLVLRRRRTKRNEAPTDVDTSQRGAQDC